MMKLIFTRHLTAKRLKPPGLLVACLLAATGAGCGKDDVKVYRVAHEQAPAQDSKPGLKYTTPSGWEEAAPGEMRLASFKVKGSGGKLADVSVIPLPGMAGSDFNNVNRWRGQIGLQPVTEGEIAKLAEPATLAGDQAQLFDMAGTNPGSGDSTRILAAIQRRDGVAWFFKMTGDADLVAQQKPAFVEFLKSVSFTGSVAGAQLPPSHPPIDASLLESSGTPGLPPNHPPIGGAGMQSMAAAPVAADSGQSRPAWQSPSNWKEVQAGQFLVAKFIISGEADSQAAVNVSMSAGDGGGLLANANRWRNQLGLQPLGQSDLEKTVESLEISSGKAMVLDMTGTDPRTGQKARLVGAIVPQNGQTWFYKLMGNEQIVGEQKPAFTKFVQSVKY